MWEKRRDRGGRSTVFVNRARGPETTVIVFMVRTGTVIVGEGNVSVEGKSRVRARPLQGLCTF
jgi:hypothetical protein